MFQQISRAKVFQVSPADISAITDGKFIGVTSVEPDGKRVAREAHVFDESLRGLGGRVTTRGIGTAART